MLLTLGILLLPLCLLASGDEASDGADAILDALDLREWDAWFRQEAPEIGFCPSDFAQGIAEAEPGGDGAALLSGLLSAIGPYRKSAIGKCALYLGVAVLGAALRGLHPVSQTQETANIAFRAATAAVVLLSVSSEMRSAYRVLETANDASEILLPALLGFLTIGGMTNTSAAVSASFSLYASFVLRTLKTAVVPLCCIGGIFAALDTSESARLASIGRLLIRAGKWILGAAASLFGVWNIVRGAAAASADGFVLRTVKFAAGSLPIVGGAAAESAEAVYQCLMLAKNAVGLTGIAVVVLLGMKPVASVFLTRCALRGARALSEPLAGRGYAELLHALSDVMQVLMLSELAAYGMLALSVTPLLGVGRFA